MPTYRVRPSSIPKHLKIPQKSPLTRRSLDEKPPIRDTSKVFPNGDTVAATPSALHPASPGWFRLPSFKTRQDVWSTERIRARDAAKAHPYVQLRSPRSVRVYDLLTKLSVPALFIYFLFIAPGGEQSDVSIIRRWTEGIATDLKDWWANVPGDEEVDPQILIALEREKQP